MEVMEILIVAVGISILIILSYFSFTQTAKVYSSALVEQSQYERVTNFITIFFYSRIPEIDKTIAQLLTDRIVAGSDVVYYGERYGGLNVTEIMYDYFSSYFDKRWNLTIAIQKNFISFGYQEDVERVRTFVIKLPLPQPAIGGVINVLFKQW